MPNQFTNQPISVKERFWAKVNKNGPIPTYAPHLGNCWLWTSVKAHGYPMFNLTTNPLKRIRAYHLLLGKPPKGFEYDHLCRIHSCTRPEHLELVTHAENVRRGDSWRHFADSQSSKTHCPQGHPYDLFNTRIRIRPTGKAYRACRACIQLRQKARRSR